VAEGAKTEFLERLRHAVDKLRWNIPAERLAGARFLDIGCGLGAGVLAALAQGASLSVGVDRNLEEFGASPFGEVAAELGLDTTRAVLVEGELSALRRWEPGFDVALMLDVIEHVADPAQFLRGAFGYLRRGGLLLVDSSPLYYSAVGHHAWTVFPRAEMPWVHLYRDAEQCFASAALSEWHRSRIAELNKATYMELRTALVDAGFTIRFEHCNAPAPEDLRRFEVVADRLDPTKLPAHADLFREWVLFIAERPPA
jgi:SAM-dependent methyltransferase